MSWRPRTAGGWAGRALAVLAVGLFARNLVAHAFVADDAFISFRYARNLLDGLGLVWNAGERVEGYTNFLWVLWAAAGMKLGVAPVAWSLATNAAAGLALLGCVARLSAQTTGRPPVYAGLVAVALAANESFVAWTSGGLETMTFSALVFGAYARWFHEWRGSGGRRWVSAALFSAAALTRPEGLLFAALPALCTVTRRRLPRRDRIAWLAVFALPVAAHLSWRVGYYGAWLPNTFHAKVPGAWWDQGVRYLRLFADDFHLVAWIPALVVGAFVWRRFEHAVLGATLLAYLLYVAYVGGDRFGFRFLVPVLAPAYWLLGEAVAGLAASARRPVAAKAVAWAAGAAVLLATLAGGRFAAGDGERFGVAGRGRVGGYAARRVEEGRFLRAQIEAGRLPRELTICVGGAGAVPFYTGWTTIDRRGINDRFLARRPLPRRGTVAHERDAPFEYLRRRGVVVFDAFNRLVHDAANVPGRGASVRHDGHVMPVLAVPLAGRAFVFATPLDPDEALRRLEVERVSARPARR